MTRGDGKEARGRGRGRTRGRGRGPGRGRKKPKEDGDNPELKHLDKEDQEIKKELANEQGSDDEARKYVAVPVIYFRLFLNAPLYRFQELSQRDAERLPLERLPLSQFV